MERFLFCIFMILVNTSMLQSEESEEDAPYSRSIIEIHGCKEKPRKSTLVVGISGVVQDVNHGLKYAENICQAVDGYNVTWIHNTPTTCKIPVQEHLKMTSYLLRSVIEQELNELPHNKIVLISYDQSSFCVKTLTEILSQEHQKQISVLILDPACFLQKNSFCSLRYLVPQKNSWGSHLDNSHKQIYEQEKALAQAENNIIFVSEVKNQSTTHPVCIEEIKKFFLEARGESDKEP